MVNQNTNIGEAPEKQPARRKIPLKAVAKYTFLPGLIPRMKDFAGSGFGYLAHLMAVVYQIVRLLPPQHPYCNPANIGRFGIRHVIAEAANNLTFKRENLDQIIIFFAMLTGFVILVAQIVLVVVSLVSGSVFAAVPFTGLFSTPSCPNGVPANPACKDIAFMMLDRVFAIPGLYNSTLGPASAATIPPYNQALQTLFQFYSMTMLVVGVLIFLYYIVLIIGESAATGTPFGRRFNHIWAPLRLVVAVGLLVPMNYGLNSAQYITLFAAKWGSSFATNGWIQFNNTLLNPIGVPDRSNNESHLVTQIKRPDLKPIVQFMALVQTCKHAYKQVYGVDIKPYLVTNQPINSAIEITSSVSPAYKPFSDPASALSFYEGRNVFIRFGQQSQADFPNEKGFVEPSCGEIFITTHDVQNDGLADIQEGYYKYVLYHWFNNISLSQVGDRYTAFALTNDRTGSWVKRFACRVAVPNYNGCPDSPLPDAQWKRSVTELQLSGIVDNALRRGRNGFIQQLKTNRYDVSNELIERGWGGAGIWYNKIAEWNGSLTSAAAVIPTPSLMPRIMADLENELRSHRENINPDYRYVPFKPNGDDVDFLTAKELEIADVLNLAYMEWNVDQDFLISEEKTSGNILYDVVHAIFGVSGLYDIRHSQDTHPLAQLSAIGKSLIEGTIRNLMVSLAFSTGSGAAKILQESGQIAGALQGMSSMFMGFATVGLTLGFVLYFVLPFLPFIYFFFAVGKWVKGVFEAMVGVPLWALAHLKVDGNGLPGETAMNGYFLIFEVFFRPILCVFGLIAGIVIFSALARTLNEIFDLVVHNMTGFDCTGMQSAAGDCFTVMGFDTLQFKRNVIDEFFFTILYTMIVYIMAQSSFKLIDQIPNNIIRWLGAGVQSFGDQSEDLAGNIQAYASLGARQIGGEVMGAANTGANVMGQAGGGLTKRLFGADTTPKVAGTGKTGNLPGGGST